MLFQAQAFVTCLVEYYNKIHKAGNCVSPYKSAPFPEVNLFRRSSQHTIDFYIYKTVLSHLNNCAEIYGKIVYKIPLFWHPFIICMLIR